MRSVCIFSDKNVLYLFFLAPSHLCWYPASMTPRTTNNSSIDAGKGWIDTPADSLTQSLADNVVNRSQLRSEASVTLRTITKLLIGDVDDPHDA